MSDVAERSGSFVSPGATLRAAREAKGLHIAALAAALKVPQAKLEALESDRFADLPDATFVRALALSVCRYLRIDAAPVLALLPSSQANGLAHLHEGINAPFRSKAVQHESQQWALSAHPMAWATGLVAVAALLLFVLPASLWQGLLNWPQPAGSAVALAASAPVGPAPAALAPSARPTEPEAAASASAASAAVVETVHPSPGPMLTVDAPALRAPAPAAPSTAAVTLSVKEASWVEAHDAGRQLLLSRLLQPGEAVSLDGAMPLQLKIGNAAATSLSLRGQPFDLSPFTRDNVARVELK